MLRKLKRQKDRDSDELPLHQQRLPTGQNLAGASRGAFISLPLLGTVSYRARDDIPLVMLVVALLTEQAGQGGLMGMLEIELPLYPETEKGTLAALERYGWSGMVWKEGDTHWPTGDEGSLEQLRSLLSHEGLRASLTFPPDSVTGNVRTQPLEVLRASGRFLMPALEEPAEPPHPDKVEALRGIVRAYRDFYLPEGADA